jgi:hypothetical protein
MADFYQESAEARIERLDYQRQLALTSLQEARLMNDLQAGGEAAQEIADVDAAKANLVRLHNSYIQSQQPQYQTPETPEEMRVKAVERMTPNDGLKVSIANSRYGKDLDWNDPNVQAGYAEVQRRRGRGE